MVDVNEQAMVVLTDCAACVSPAQAVTTLHVLMQSSTRADEADWGCLPLLLLLLASHAAGKHPDSFALFHRVLRPNMTAQRKKLHTPQ
jgi:hypothetical protein